VDIVDDITVHTGPSHPTSGLRCEHGVLDANIMGMAGIDDNNWRELCPQHIVIAI